MGQKGDRAAKEPLAIRMYAEGKTLEAIAADLDISPTSLRNWKSQTMIPGGEIDEWDRARQQRRNMSCRLKDIYEEQVKYIEELRPDERTAPMIDALSKMGALVEKHAIREKTIQAVKNIEIKAAGTGRKSLDPETMKIIKEEIYGIA